MTDHSEGSLLDQEHCRWWSVSLAPARPHIVHSVALQSAHMSLWDPRGIRDGPKLWVSQRSHFQGPSPNTFINLLNRPRRRSRFSLCPPQLRQVIISHQTTHLPSRTQVTLVTHPLTFT